MNEPYKIILGPVVTERSQKMREADNKYVFRVDPRANKIEIRRAVEIIFGEGQKDFKVENVRVMKVRGKMKRMGSRRYKSPGWKKAVVKLKQGLKIEMFEA